MCNRSPCTDCDPLCCVDDLRHWLREKGTCFICHKKLPRRAPPPPRPAAPQAAAQAMTQAMTPLAGAFGELGVAAGREMPEGADTFSDIVHRRGEFGVMLLEHRVQGLEHRATHVPVEVVRLQVQRVGIGQQTRQAVADLAAGVFANTDIDTRCGGTHLGNLRKPKPDSIIGIDPIGFQWFRLLVMIDAVYRSPLPPSVRATPDGALP